MAVRIQLRRDTAANWTSSNPILRAGEIGIETDTNKMKIGTGSAAWNSISVYANITPSGLDALLANKQDVISGVSNTEIGYLDGVTSAIQTQIDAKAALNSPTFTGTPTLPTGTIATTQTAGNNTTAVATTAFVTTAVANLIDSAPGALDTLNELAAAMGDDANFATTLTTSISSKIAKSDITAKGAILIGTGAGTYTSQTVGTNGQVLTANSAQADGVEWTTLNALPSQSGNAGKYLTTDGTTASWAPAATETPHPFAMIG
jgi:hypothetical protein